MRLSIFAAGLTALMSGCSYAQAIESAPFQLVVLSSNATINGTILGACHEGAAIEGLCPAGSLSPGISEPYTTYTFNTSYTTNSSIGDPGYLIWHLTLESGNGTMVVPEVMRLSTDPTSNVAVPIFVPSDTEVTYVAFDTDGLMNIQSYVDDTTDPAGHATKAFYNWYLCTTYYSYTYTTLAWAIGADAKPQNPTCQKVQIKRVFNAAQAYAMRFSA